MQESMREALTWHLLAGRLCQMCGSIQGLHYAIQG